MAVLDTIKQEFPQWAWAFSHPELGPILREAAGGVGFSPNTFKAKIQGTKWWKGQSAAQRDWQILIHNDPGQAKAKRNLGQRLLGEAATRLGVKLSSKQRIFLSEIMNSKGLSPDDPAMVQAIYNIYKQQGVARGPGAITTARKQARNIATREYFVNMSEREAINWGINMATGRMTEDDLRQQMSARAASRYAQNKSLVKSLNEGASMRDLFDGHIQLIADTLEIDPDLIDLSKGRWSKVVDSVDQETGDHYSLNLGDTEVLAKRDDRYWGTKQGKASAAGLTQMIYKSFGLR